jgi:hypothetical protein
MPWFTIIMWSLGSIIILALYKGIRSYDFAHGCPVCRKKIAAILCNDSEQNKFCYKHTMWIQDIKRLERNYLDKPIDWTLHNVFFDEILDQQLKQAEVELEQRKVAAMRSTVSSDNNWPKPMYVRPPEYDEYVLFDGHGRELQRCRL